MHISTEGRVTIISVIVIMFLVIAQLVKDGYI